MSNLKKKKYYALLGIVLLIVGLIGLFTFGRVDKYKGKINLVKVKSNSKVLSSVGNTVALNSMGTDEVDYTLNYTLDTIDGVNKRNVEIKATLQSSINRYAKFKEIHSDNMTSHVSENGDEITINITDVPLGIEQSVVIKIMVTNAPNGTTIKPTIDIKEQTGNYTRISTEEIQVVTNSLQGKVVDKNNNPLSDIELSLNLNGDEVKRTYTDENGNFVFSDIDNVDYTIKIEEEIYELEKEKVVNTSSTDVVLVANEVEPYTIETHKYIEKLDLVINGKKETYYYKDAEKVIQNVKNAKTISGQIEYKIVVSNIGKKSGKIMKVQDHKGEGLSFNAKKNTGWNEADGVLYYKPIEGSSLRPKEKREIKLILDIDNTNEIKTYINKLTAKGEIYENVVYIIDGKKYREEEVLEGDYIDRPDITLSNFTGWYTDKNYTNKYNFKNPVTKDLILYGYTQVNHCKVTFMDWGSVYDEQQIVCGENATKPNDPRHTGYDFVKWIKNNNDEFDFNNPVEDDVIVTSKYDLVTYTIDYNYNGGSLPDGVTNPSTYTIETPSFTINNPSKKGYEFIGWTEHNGDTPEVNVTINTGTTGNKTFTANYRVIEYPITYNLNGGNLQEGKTNRNKYTIEDEFTLNNPSKEGYEFIGWTGTDLTGNTTEVTVERGSTGPREYTANYRTIAYTISYDGLTQEEAENLHNPTSYTIESDPITLVNPQNRKDEYNELTEIFTGWTGSNGNDASTSVTIPTGSIGNKHYTANWIDADPNSYPITYNLKNGTLGKDDQGRDIENPSSYTKNTETFTLHNPSKKGYNFTGWTGTDLSTLTTEVTITKGSRGARAYEANYTAKEYTITYNLDGGALADGVTNPSTYTIESDPITLNNPSKRGYTFIGWVGTDVDTPSTEVTIPTGSTGNREYTAKYTKDEYTITYDLDGGSLPEGVTNPTTYTVTSDDIAINNPTKEGYTFIGWVGTDVDTPSTEVIIPTGSIGNREYVAHYQAIEYTITYDLDGGALAEGVTNPSTYTIETETFTINNPTKEGARFKGWTGTDLTSETTEVTIRKGSTGNRSYLANYGPNVFLVKFINEGNLYATKTVNGGETVANAGTPYSSDSHKIFKYWSLDKSTEYDFSTPVNSDLTLYSVYDVVEPPVITHTPTYWTNQNVTVTVTSDHEDYTYMYKNGDGSYTSYSTPFEVEENTTIYAYSKKGSAQSVEASHDITNIDKIKPRINNISASGVSTTSFTINVAAVDDESGIASITVYKDDVLVGEYLYPEEDTSEKIKSIELSNLSENTTYRIKAIARDKAGNISDEVEKDISTNEPIVARIIGEDNQLWDSSSYINFASLQEAIEYSDCVSSQCTIQMVTGTVESNTILSGQDITLDLNGQIVKGLNSNYTINNLGLFTLVDNNEDYSGVLYNSDGVSLLNSGENSILTIGVNDPEYNVSTEKPRVIGKTYGVNKTAGTLNFYDGYIEGITAINGIVDDTPYLYNARVSSISQSDEVIKQKAILSKVADAEARIGSVYYTKLSDAINQSNIGNLDSVTEDSTFEDSIITYGDYGFHKSGKKIIPDASHIEESKSVIPIDLTDATDNQTILITYKRYDTSMQSGQGIIRDKLGYYEDTNYNFSVYGVEPYTQSFVLTPGKIYYMSLSGNIEVDEIRIGTMEMENVGSLNNVTKEDSVKLYGFDYDPETKTFRSNNNYEPGSIAYSYMEVDLTNKTGKYDVTISATGDMWQGFQDYGIIAISDTKKYSYATYNLDSNAMTAYITPSSSSYSSYANLTSPRIQYGNYLYNRSIDGGKKYYIQFYYYKSSNTMPREYYESYGVKDELIINSIGVYPHKKIDTVDLNTAVTPGDYGFSYYYSTFQSASNLPDGQVSHSYIPIDLTDVSTPTMARITGNFGTGCDFSIGNTTSTEMPSSNEFQYHTSDYSYHSYRDSDVGDRNPVYINLVPGQMNYIHLVNRTKNTVSIGSIDIVNGKSIDLEKNLKNSGSIGFSLLNTDNSDHYQMLSSGQTADSYVKLDFRSKTSNQVVNFALRSYSNNDAKYVYVTDNPNNLPYSYFKENKDKSVYFLDYNWNYSDYRGSSGYNNEYHILLPKGKTYYLHFGSYLPTTFSGSSRSMEIANVTYTDVTDIPIYTGNNPYINHGTEPIKYPYSTEEINGTSDFRFIGSKPDNYIRFNNELWRIVGVFETEDESNAKKNRIKIVRDQSIGSYSWDTTKPTGETGSLNEGKGINEWSQSDVMKLLNPGYDNNSEETYKINPTLTTITKYSHTDNISDSGQQSGVYANNIAKNDIVTIPGATSITIEVWFSTESTNYDWLAIYPAGVTPSASNSTSATISGGKIGGGNSTTKPADSNTSYHKTYTVNGDTAQFFFRSDGSGQYYGYYAKIKGIGYDPNIGDYESLGNNNVNNSLYWNKTSGNCFTKKGNYTAACDFSTNGLSEDAKQYIDKVKWYTGAVNDNFMSSTTLDVYNAERGTATGKDDLSVGNGDTYPLDEVDRTTSWYGKVGLLYPSDYILALDDQIGTPLTRDVCLDSTLTGSIAACLTTNNWLYRNSNATPMYSITPTNGSYNGSTIKMPYNVISLVGTPFNSTPTEASTAYEIRPSVYLSTKTVISSGTGSIDDPYTITLGESDNPSDYYGLVSASADISGGEAQEYVPYETEDYKKIKNMDSFGYEYDEDTGYFMSMNYGVMPSVASTTIKIDLSSKTGQTRMDFEQNMADGYKTFFVVNESPDPIFYSSYFSFNHSGYGNNFDRNYTTTSGYYYLEPKVYYVHLGYLHYQDDSYYGNMHRVKLMIDGGTFTDYNKETTYTYERNDDIDTIQVLKNISLDYPIEIEKNRSVIIDLNGYTLNSIRNGTMVQNQGELEIIDTKVNLDGTTSGKLLNNNGIVISNEKDANLKLTSGNIETTRDGVRNIGLLTMGEAFDISSSQIAINNVDGIINDLAGTISNSITGVMSSSDLQINGENSGSIVSISGPFEVNASEVGLNGACNVNNTRIVGARTGIICHGELNTDNVVIDGGTTGIQADLFKRIKNTNISVTGSALYGGFSNEESIFENVVTDSGYTIEMTSGEFTMTDDIDINFTGGFSISGSNEVKPTLTIDLNEKQITRGYDYGETIHIHSSNGAYLYVKSLAPTDIDNNATINSTRFKAENVEFNNLNINGYGRDDASAEITNTTINNFVTRYSSPFDEPPEEKRTINFTGGSVRKYENGVFKATEFTYNSIMIVNFNGTTFGDAGTSATTISNIGETNLVDCIVNGATYNRFFSTLTADNTSFDRLYLTVYDGYYANSTGGTKTEHYKNSSLATINNSTIQGLYVGDSSQPDNTDGNPAQQNNRITINNTTVTTGTVQPNAAVTMTSGTITDSFNNKGDLILGIKGDEMTTSSPIVNELTNSSDLYLYDGKIIGENPEPISGVGNVKEIESGYSIKISEEDSKYAMYLSNGDMVAQIGNQQFASLKAAIDSITDTEENVEITILKDHITADQIVNDKNVTINLNGKKIKVYSEVFITNNGTMSIIGDENSELRRMNNNNTAKVCLYKLENTRDTIINNGTLNMTDVATYGFNLRNNHSSTINGDTSIKNVLNASGTMNIGNLTTEILSNFGSATISDIDVEYIHNNYNMTVNTNHNHDTVVNNYTKYTSSNTPAYLALKSGTYKNVEQIENYVGSETDYEKECQTIRIGDNDSDRTTIKYNIYVRRGNIIMNNTDVLDQGESSYPVKTLNCNSSEIYNSSIKSNTTIDASVIQTDGNLILNDSTVTCKNTGNYSSTCTAVSGHSLTMTNSILTGVNGVVSRGTRSDDKIVINSGSITASKVGINAPGYDITVLDGDISYGTYGIYAYRGSGNSRYSKSINIGTNSTHTGLGSPSIVSTKSGSIGIYADGPYNVYFANGELKSVSTTMSLLPYYYSSYYKYPINLDVGTIYVEGEDASPYIESTGGYAIVFNGNSNINNNINVYRGTIKAYNNAINTSNGNYLINVGNHNDTDMKPTNPHIEGGVYGINTASTTSNYQQVNIYDGEIIGQTGKSQVGGVRNIEDGFTLMTTSIGSGKERTYLDTPKMAAIGSTEYDTIAEAVEAASGPEDVIKILNNFSYVDSMGQVDIPAGKNIKIDFNGKTINNKSTNTFINNNGILELANVSTTGNDAPIVNAEGAVLTYTSGTLVSTIDNNGTVEITDGTIKKLDNKGTATMRDGTVTTVVNSDTFTVEDGTISSLTSSGDTTITGGTINNITETAGTISFENATSSGVTLNDGEFYLLSGTINNPNGPGITAKAGTLTIGEKGGEPSTTSPSIVGTSAINYTGNSVVNYYDGVLSGANTVVTSSVNRNYINDIEPNYQIYVKKNDSVDTMTLKQIKVIKNTTTNVEYNDVQSAIDAAGSGETLQLMNSIVPLVGDNAFEVGSSKNIVFDLNGYNIYSKTNTFVNNGTLEIISSRDYTTSTDQYNELHYLSITNNGTLSNTGFDGSINKLIIENNGTANIDGLTVNSATITNAAGSTFNGSDISIQSSTITNNGNMVLDNVTSTSSTQTNTSSLRIINTNNFELNINNSGTLELNRVETTTNSLIKNSDTVNITESSMRFSTSSNDTSSSVFNITSGTFNFLQPFTNNGTINVSADTSGLYVINNNEINITDGTQSGARLQGGNINISGGSTSGTVGGSSTNNINVTGGRVANITTGTSTIIDNAEVYDTLSGTATIRNGSTVATLENSGTSTISNSTVNKIEGTGTVTITDSTVGSVKDISSITSNNTTYNGYVIADNIYITGGSITGQVGHLNRDSYSRVTEYTEEIYLTDVTVTGFIYGIDIQLTNSDVTGDIEASRNNIANNYHYDHVRQVKLKDSTVTGNIIGPYVEVDNSTVNGAIGTSEALGEVLIKSGSVTTEADIAVQGTAITLGENDDNVDTINPVIEGASIGVKTQNLSYYDGSITGGSVAIDGKLANIAANYKINLLTINGKSNATLTTLGEDEIVADTNNKFFADLQAAINDCVDGGTVKLHRDVTLEYDVIISEGKSITIDLNNHVINNDEHLIGNYTTIDSTNPGGVGGAIYRFLASIIGAEINPRDIIIYQMDDGSELLSEKTYKLYKYIDDEYKIVKVNESEIGDYYIGREITNLRTTNGKINIRGIGEGTYKLVGSDSKELQFTISEKTVSNNIRQNLYSSRNKVVSTAIATLILQLQTGMIRTPYILIILLILSMISVGYIFNQKRKKDYE